MLKKQLELINLIHFKEMIWITCLWYIRSCSSNTSAHLLLIGRFCQNACWRVASCQELPFGKNKQFDRSAVLYFSFVYSLQEGFSSPYWSYIYVSREHCLIFVWALLVHRWKLLCQLCRHCSTSFSTFYIRTILLASAFLSEIFGVSFFQWQWCTATSFFCSCGKTVLVLPVSPLRGIIVSAVFSPFNCSIF